MTNNKPPVAIPVEMETKLSTLLNDKRVLRQKDTFASRASADFDLENSGRFSKATQVIGPDGAQYPRLPEGSWTNDPVGVEPPIGFGINEVPIVGEVGEIQASIERLERSADQSGLPSHADGPSVEAAGSLIGHEVEPPLTQSPTPTGLGDPTPLGAVQRRRPTR
jgi:hypothetical protein